MFNVYPLALLMWQKFFTELECMPSPALETGISFCFSSFTVEGSDWTAASFMSLLCGGTTMGTGTWLKQEKRHNISFAAAKI